MTHAPTAENLSEAVINQVDRWIKEGIVKTPYEIGNGHCYEFAEEIMAYFNEPYGQGYSVADSYGHLVDVTTDDWWARNPDKPEEADMFVMDIALLRHEGAPLPEWAKDDDNDFACFLGSCTHNWLVLDGRHYDADCIQGAAHFLDMPFFAQQIARYGEINHGQSRKGPLHDQYKDDI